MEDRFMNKAVIYIHGKGRNAGEAAHYIPPFILLFEIQSGYESLRHLLFLL